MKILTNHNYVASRKRLGQIFSFLGIGVLVAGFILTFTAEEGSQLSYLSLFSLPLGWILSQVGLYFSAKQLDLLSKALAAIRASQDLSDKRLD